MSALDVQIVRAGILTEAHRPTPEPDETELRRIVEHIGTSPEAPAEAETTEAAR
jgi:hypothetical protein